MKRWIYRIQEVEEVTTEHANDAWDIEPSCEQRINCQKRERKVRSGDGKDKDMNSFTWKLSRPYMHYGHH